MRWPQIVLALAIPLLARSYDVNHVGRVLPKLNLINSVLEFGTVANDVVMASLQIFPRNNSWNEDISRLPLLANSAAIIASSSDNFKASSRTLLSPTYELNWVLVPKSQDLVDITFGDYEEESDPGPYPIPRSQPLSPWPLGLQDSCDGCAKNADGSYVVPTLAEFQICSQEWMFDFGRETITVVPETGEVFDTVGAVFVSDKGSWQAIGGARFNLNSNALREEKWTSADAAGTPLLAGVVRYDELERGVIEHALRCTLHNTREDYIYPATHYASDPSTKNISIAAMGQRLRLRSNFVISSSWHSYVRSIAVALKRFGCLVVGNSNYFTIVLAPDPRLATVSSQISGNLKAISVSDFEAVQSTAALEGPRSPRAPTVKAGLDFSCTLTAVCSLSGSSTFSDSLTYLWSHYIDANFKAAGVVTFQSPANLTGVVSFSAGGEYVLVLAASSGAYPTVYSAVTISVLSASPAPAPPASSDPAAPPAPTPASSAAPTPAAAPAPPPAPASATAPATAPSPAPPGSSVPLLPPAPSEPTTSGSSVGIIIGVVAAVLVLAVVIGALLLVLHYRRAAAAAAAQRKTDVVLQEPTPSSSSWGGVSLSSSTSSTVQGGFSEYAPTPIASNPGCYDFPPPRTTPPGGHAAVSSSTGYEAFAVDIRTQYDPAPPPTVYGAPPEALYGALPPAQSPEYAAAEVSQYGVVPPVSSYGVFHHPTDRC